MPQRVIRTFAAASLLALAGVSASAAAGGVEKTAVLKTGLEGAEDMEANIVEFEVGADWETKRHFHPGHVFVYVTEGAIEIDVEGREPRVVSAGEAIYELPDRPMVGRTAGTADGAKFTVFQVGPRGEPLMVTTD